MGARLVKMNNDLSSLFSSFAHRVITALKLPQTNHRFHTFRWVDMPVKLDNPRFGVSEALNQDNKLELLVSKELLDSFKHLKEWVFWREAVLEHLCYRVRKVPEVADLGLYAGLKFGTKRSRERWKLHVIWETLSPPKNYGHYEYNPAAGFHFFDEVVEGTFLERIIPWLNTTFCGVPFPLTTQTFTAALERWMFDYHRPLQPSELRLLVALSKQPEITQQKLAKQVKLTQPSVSKILKRLANRHLLRFIRFINLPLIGLQRITATFHSRDFRFLYALRKLLMKIRYIQSIQELGDSLLCSFTIPFRRITRFRRWIAELATAWNLDSPKIRTIIEISRHRDFTLYNPKQGEWPQDYESILENVFRVFNEEMTSLLPPIHSVKYPLSIPQKLKLQPEDFVYMQRANRSFYLTEGVDSTEAEEARLAGYPEGQHLTYRRRVRVLKKANLLSPPLGVGLIHVGLNAVINLFVEASHTESSQLLSAFQFMPQVNGYIFDDGCSLVILLVPKAAAVAILTSLEEHLHKVGIPNQAIVKPTWENYGWAFQPPVSLRNYDFDRQAWVWAKDTLPMIRPPDF